ncbi:MAG: radical SAM protein [Thermoprotei archaeon]|nr:MAG: radical SAM protein [Thermoprotei archaeon]RLF17181.1 MAG: radical SAM protein [Thermoprotei archaeon]
MKKTWAGSLVVNSLPEGCSMCMKGEKLVLFVTGLCRRGCFYCPLSRQRRGRDVVYANERPVERDDDLLEEAELMDAKGAGLTGGDPLLKPQRTLHYVKMLKEKFGEAFHIHLYTTTGPHVDRKVIKELVKLGLDEMRFHPLLDAEDPWLSCIRVASDEGLTVGLEVPAVPGMEERLRELAMVAEELGATFININELEMNEENAFQLRARGFKIKPSSMSGVEGSEDLALRLMEWIEEELSLSAHYCPAFIKDAYQYRNRLKRKAIRVAKPYEEVTDDGLLRKGVVVGDFKFLQGLKHSLTESLGLATDMVSLDPSRGVLELPVEVLKIAKKLGRLKGVDAFIVEEYPTYDRRLSSYLPI